MTQQQPHGPHLGGAGTDSRARMRTTFRVLGILVFGAALVLMGIAVADFFAVARSDDFSAEPTKFWMFFLGVPLFGLGGFLLQLGFSGAAASYMADEHAAAMRTAGRNLGLGSPGAPAPHAAGPYCRSCGRQNDVDARFCDGCGSSMSV
ncbi:MAG TPA: zinc ribbon domain-containing protein [Nocardioidaceae bacterium]|nr:zinc ribbon domain-containing protein [Nocardioidaceae bacterium]